MGLYAVTALLGVLQSAAFASEKVFSPTEMRVPPPPTGLRGTPDVYFQDVVALEDTGTFRCTGTLIGAAAVLTARHCLPVTGVRFGSDLRRFIAAAALARRVIPEAPEVDLAILFLDNAHRVTYRPLRTAQAPPYGSLRLIGVGAATMDQFRCDPRHHFVLLGDQRTTGTRCFSPAVVVRNTPAALLLHLTSNARNADVSRKAPEPRRTRKGHMQHA